MRVSSPRKIIIFVFLAAFLVWGAAEVRKRVPKSPTPTPPAQLQGGLQEIKVDDKNGNYSAHGRIESLEDSVATVVTLDSRLVIRLGQLPLYQAQAVEFEPADLPSAQISDFALGSEVVIVYNYLGYPEKVVLIRP